MAQEQTRDAIKALGVSETAAAKFVEVPLAVQEKLPQRKTVNDSGRFESRRLFYMKPKKGWWGV